MFWAKFSPVTRGTTLVDSELHFVHWKKHVAIFSCSFRKGKENLALKSSPFNLFHAACKRLRAGSQWNCWRLAPTVLVEMGRGRVGQVHTGEGGSRSLYLHVSERLNNFTEQLQTVIWKEVTQGCWGEIAHGHAVLRSRKKPVISGLLLCSESLFWHEEHKVFCLISRKTVCFEVFFLSQKLLASSMETCGSSHPDLQRQYSLGTCTNLLYQFINTGKLSCCETAAFVHHVNSDMMRISLGCTDRDNCTMLDQLHIIRADTRFVGIQPLQRQRHKHVSSFDSLPCKLSLNCSTFIFKINCYLVHVCNSETGLSWMLKTRDIVQLVIENGEIIFFTLTGLCWYYSYNYSNKNGCFSPSFYSLDKIETYFHFSIGNS